MECKSSILAGIFIGIGGVAFISVSSKELGSALFALGLLSVILLGCSLYTGKVGYIEKPSEILVLVKMCIGNFIGAAAVGLSASLFCGDRVLSVVEAKIAQPLGIVFLKSIFCGIMIYLAVDLYKKTQNIFLVILPIMIFILCGFEHCVANVFYFAAARTLNFDVVLFIVVCILGNAAGSLLIRFMDRYKL